MFKVVSYDLSLGSGRKFLAKDEIVLALSETRDFADNSYNFA